MQCLSSTWLCIQAKKPPPDNGIDAALKDKTSKEEEKLLEDFFSKDDLKNGDGSDLKGVEVKFIPEDPSVINPEEYEELDIEDTELFQGGQGFWRTRH